MSETATQNSNRVFVVGVGMTKFEKPGPNSSDWPDLCKTAITRALEDSKLSYTDVQAAVVGYNYGEPTCGQAAVYQMGLTGIPICNVNNNCSTGSTALFLARNLLSSYDCTLALGFEKMQKSLSQVVSFQARKKHKNEEKNTNNSLFHY